MKPSKPTSKSEDVKYSVFKNKLQNLQNFGHVHIVPQKAMITPVEAAVGG